MATLKKILIIEPDKVLGQTLSSALKSNGYKVVHVATAQDGVTQADQTTPDLVILELQLVGHSGIEFLCEFRSYRDWANVPVIIYSSVPPLEFGASQDSLRGELGVVAYLYKASTSLLELLRTIEDNLSMRRELKVDAAT